MTDQTIAWLRDLAEKGGKGIVNNIDARSLGRIADELETLTRNAQCAPGFFSEKVDAWGATEWFNRLAQAIHAQDAAVVAGDMPTMEMCQNVAASSAMRLVREYEQQVRAALTSSNRVAYAAMLGMSVEEWRRERAIAEQLNEASAVPSTDGGGK